MKIAAQRINIEKAEGLTIKAVRVFYDRALVVYTNNTYSFLEVEDNYGSMELNQSTPAIGGGNDQWFVEVGLVSQEQVDRYYHERSEAATKARRVHDKLEYERLKKEFGE